VGGKEEEEGKWETAAGLLVAGVKHPTFFPFLPLTELQTRTSWRPQSGSFARGTAAESQAQAQQRSPGWVAGLWHNRSSRQWHKRELDELDVRRKEKNAAVRAAGMAGAPGKRFFTEPYCTRCAHSDRRYLRTRRCSASRRPAACAQEFAVPHKN
jgi:hypothetical protein